MLRFIAGHAGTGKTTYLMQEIRQRCESGGRAILLVPEQYSFESEKRLYRILGAKNSLNVEVLSFTRLCDSVFRRLGGISGAPVTPAARYLLMSVVVSELQDNLVVYRKSARNIGCLQTLLAACSEFKTAGITPKGLEEFLAQCSKGQLHDKLHDLSLIYSGYQALLSAGYSDPEDSLIRACERLELENFFAGISVYVDGFTTFMAAEFELLGHVISQADETVFALTTATLADNHEESGAFTPVIQAAARLSRIAHDAGIDIAKPVILSEALRYKNKPLAHLAQYFSAQPPVIFDDEASQIRTLRAPDLHIEIQSVAAEIARLVRDEGCAYRDIAVIARDPAQFLYAIELAFERYEIPFFADNTRDVESSPLAALLISALDSVSLNYDAQSMLLLARSPVIGIDDLQAAVLENYCYVWSVRGSLWQTEFTNHPNGLFEEFTESDREQLKIANELRVKLIDPLIRLRDNIHRETGRELARGIFEYLEEIHAAENLSAYVDSLPAPDNDIFLNDSMRLWDAIIEILEIFAGPLGNVHMPWRRLCELFRLALSTCEVGSLPQTLDQVLVGGADRIRPESLKHVFIIGANEGVFPAAPVQGGVFTADEREAMISSGLEIPAFGLSQALLEQFFAYFALTLPSESLTVSRHDNGSAPESMLLTQLDRIFPKHAALKLSPLDFVANERTAFSLLASNFRQDSELTASLLAAFESMKPEMTERMERLAIKRPHELLNRQNAISLFGKSMRLSPSRVERYHRCPFAFFMQDGLAVKSRRRAEFSPLESGGVVHHVMQIMVARHGGGGLAHQSEEQLAAEVEIIIHEYLAARIENMEALPRRVLHLFSQMCKLLARLLLRLGQEFEQSLFEPLAYELPISRNEGVPPLVLKTPGGALVSVEGIVDRVDIMQKNGVRYVRVIDYKSGRRSFRLNDVMLGLNLQMLLYLFTIEKNGQNELESAIPAGVLYMPMHEAPVSAARNESDEVVESKRLRQLRMDGILLDDYEALRGMEPDLKGIFLPVKLGRDGKPSPRSALASREELGSLATKLERTISDMVDALLAGKIPARPIDDTEYNVCAHCDYRSACGFESGDPVREIAKLDRDAFFKELEEEQAEIPKAD